MITQILTGTKEYRPNQSLTRTAHSINYSRKHDYGLTTDPAAYTNKLVRPILGRTSHFQLLSTYQTFALRLRQVEAHAVSHEF
jgi:hypothetical protein